MTNGTINSHVKCQNISIPPQRVCSASVSVSQRYMFAGDMYTPRLLSQVSAQLHPYIVHTLGPPCLALLFAIPANAASLPHIFNHST